MESTCVLDRVGDPTATPRCVAVDGVPFAVDSASKAEISFTAAVCTGLYTEKLSGRDGHGVGADGLSIVDCALR
jgi:hypothetical protein